MLVHRESEGRMGYISGEGRGQATLFPASLDEYISADNPVRFIDGFVSGLNLRELKFVRAEAAATGRRNTNLGICCDCTSMAI